MDHLAEIISFESPLLQLHPLFKCVHCSLLFFYVFSAEGLARGISLHQFLRPFSNREPTAFETDALST